MTLSAQDFKNRSRDPQWERELAQELRQIPEQERLKFLLELLSVNQVVALDLARKSLSERNSFETLLENGLQSADASTIRYWLESVVPGLGFPRVVRQLRRHSQSYPAGVKKARYWLTSFSRAPGYSKAKADLEALFHDMD